MKLCDLHAPGRFGDREGLSQAYATKWRPPVPVMPSRLSACPELSKTLQVGSAARMSAGLHGTAASDHRLLCEHSASPIDTVDTSGIYVAA